MELPGLASKSCRQVITCLYLLFFQDNAMSLAVQQLLQIPSSAGQSAGVYVFILSAVMSHCQIVGGEHIAVFIAQIGHESG